MNTQRYLLILIFLSPLFGIAQQNNTPEITAQFGKGVNIKAADNSFSMKLGFRMQTLAVFSHTLGDTENPLDHDFMIRRSRVKADGFMFSPKLKYKVELGLTNRDLESNQRGDEIDNPGPILDAVIKWNFAGNWEVWFGQTKLPGNRERLISSSSLQFVDRSLINSKFTTDRDAGFWLTHKTKGKVVVKNSFAITTGEGKNRSTGKNKNTAGGGLSYSYRGEILPMGNFAKKGDYFEGDLSREETPKLAIGVAANFNDDAVRSQGQLGKYFVDGETQDIYSLFADYIFKYKGFAAQGEFAMKDNALPGMTPSESRSVVPTESVYVLTGMGISNQMSYIFKNNVEIAARYAYLKSTENIRELVPIRQDFTVGISKYLVAHKLKVQSDLSLINTNEENQLQGRFQVEVHF